MGSAVLYVVTPLPVSASDCHCCELSLALLITPLGCAASSWASAWQNVIFSPAEHLIQGVCDL